ncbi:MAG: hypothetical protein L3J49_11015, partial [Desulfobulbaceae bacterium]|nr:hypothetical protein [Desulfobulbaceae bacterium]
DCLPHNPIAELRTLLRKTMPQEVVPLYTSITRNRFFKQGIFFRFSAAALEAIGLKTEGRSGVVCFLAAKDSGLYGWSRAVLLPD